MMRETEEPRPAYILNRGSYDARGGKRSRLIRPRSRGISRRPATKSAVSARWLTDPDHSLTARVAVNRYWQMIFGVGLVRTPEDFGSQGSNPTHPELLDWLARDFVNHSWDLHRLLRQMVLSATYRQSTFGDLDSMIADPENLTFCRSVRNRRSGRNDSRQCLGGKRVARRRHWRSARQALRSCGLFRRDGARRGRRIVPKKLIHSLEAEFSGSDDGGF